MTDAGLSTRVTRRLGVRPGFLAGASSPTVDLYFAFACADRIARGEVRQLAPTVFAADDTLIVFRHAAGLSQLPPHRRLIYLIDDDIRAGLSDRGVPADYRLKLLALDWPAVRQFERQADVILTTSPRLAELLRARRPGTPVHEIEPAWPLPAAMPSPPTNGACRIALLMGRSHARDAAPLMRVFGQLLTNHPKLELILSANLPVPNALRRAPGVEVLPALNWAAYFDWLKVARFDIGLVPHLAAGPFNAARSISKLGEFAMAGAAVLASDSWPAGAAAALEGRCALAGPNDWREAIEGLIADPARIRALAHANDAALRHADLAGRQRALWGELLGTAGRNAVC